MDMNVYIYMNISYSSSNLLLKSLASCMHSFLRISGSAFSNVSPYHTTHTIQNQIILIVISVVNLKHRNKED